MKFFNYDNEIYNIAGDFADILILNVLWLICSIPIFTIGSSTTALYHCTMKMVERKHTSLVKTFFKAFAENFVKSTIIWLVLLVIGICFYLDIFYLINLDSLMGKALFILVFFLFILYAMILLYIFPYIAKFDCKLKDYFKNALFLALGNFLPTILMILVVMFFGFFIMKFSFLMIIAMGTLAYTNSIILNKVFTKLINRK